jgi:hypothetical protein
MREFLSHPCQARLPPLRPTGYSHQITIGYFFFHPFVGQTTIRQVIDNHPAPLLGMKLEKKVEFAAIRLTIRCRDPTASRRYALLLDPPRALLIRYRRSKTWPTRDNCPLPRTGRALRSSWFESRAARRLARRAAPHGSTERRSQERRCLFG